jgi:hypothetical protein
MLFARLRQGFDPARASFSTHLNYIKRIGHLLDGISLTVAPGRKGARDADVERFMRLQNATHKSIRKDMELAIADPAFATIAAPWFPVKCYYALYYLETIFFHLLDGSIAGFSKGGHTGVRKKLMEDMERGILSFSSTALNSVLTLEQVAQLPSIAAGQNTRANFWEQDACTDSVLKKMSEYKLHDQHTGRKWNLHTKASRDAKKDFMQREKMCPLDFFYWHRIKANYRDFDYIDFENGITEAEVLEYMRAYYSAYFSYRKVLLEEINRLKTRP